MSRNEHADLTLVAAAFFQNVEYDAGCEYGSVGVDCKRPFGNSDVEGDILELIGWEPEGDDGESKRYSRKQREYAANLYCVKLASFLKAGTFTPPTSVQCQCPDGFCANDMGSTRYSDMPGCRKRGGPPTSGQTNPQQGEKP